MKRHQMLSYCASLVTRFPDEEVDEEVMISLLDLISLAITGSRTMTKYISDEGALKKIAVQLTIVLEEFNTGAQKMQEDDLKLSLRMFDKLMLAIVSIAKDY
jgi:hypothetical protein